MEKLLDIFEDERKIVDSPGAKNLYVSEGGTIIFEDVSFSYDSKVLALDNVSFEVLGKKRGRITR